MTDRELMQMALDALFTCQEDWVFDGEDERPTKTYDEKLVGAAFKALRARLTQPEQKPVAWYYAGSDVEWHSIALDADLDDAQKANCIPLYTAPPQREWQGLTDEELREVVGMPSSYSDWNPVVVYKWLHAIEAKLKEKNGF